MSGDSIHIESSKNLVRAGYGFNEVAVFEMVNRVMVGHGMAISKEGRTLFQTT